MVSRFQSRHPSVDINCNWHCWRGCRTCIYCYIYSFEVAAQRLQIQGPLKPRQFHNGFELLKNIYSNEGGRGLYRGLGASLLKSLPFSGIWWASYEGFKSYVYSSGVSKKLISSSRMYQSADEQEKSTNESSTLHVTAGVFATTIATTITNPLDVAKTRLQTMHFFPASQPPLPAPPSTRGLSLAKSNNSSSPFHGTVPPLKQKGLYKPPKSHNIFSMLRLTVKEEGPRAIFKGLLASLLTQLPFMVVGVVLYEQVKILSVR